MPKKTKRHFALLNIIYFNETEFIPTEKKQSKGFSKLYVKKIRDFFPSTKLFPRLFLSLKTFCNKYRNPGYSH